MNKILCICENCETQKAYPWNDEGFKNAFNDGWDYPPLTGEFGIVSPRTCGKCNVISTVWWELEACGTPVEKLSDNHKKTLDRISNEPESIKIHDSGEV